MPSQAIAKENPPPRIVPKPCACAPWRVKALSVLPGHRLAVTFMDGKTGIVDCSTILDSKAPGIYAPLTDPVFFGQVQLELGALTWPNGADLDPAWLYDSIAGGKSWAVPF
jgi:hypothetical protein